MKRIPKHIGIIPDGNRRWAKGSGLNKEDGYAYGLEPGLKLLRAARNYGIEESTYYGSYAGRSRQPVCGKERVRVNLLVNYGWKWDMKNGWASYEIPRIDMVIRWGGMCRLSGFLPLQTVYSDFYIVKDLWPDFQEKHFTDALQWYQEQDITLGG